MKNIWQMKGAPWIYGGRISTVAWILDSGWISTEIEGGGVGPDACGGGAKGIWARGARGREPCGLTAASSQASNLYPQEEGDESGAPGSGSRFFLRH